MIGVFDSGSGGLSVLKEIVRLLPHEEYVYFADNAFCPYGEKTVEEIQTRAHAITDRLLAEGAQIVFSQDPNDYLPAVHTTWEGMECINYSPPKATCRPARRPVRRPPLRRRAWPSRTRRWIWCRRPWHRNR